ncbi:cyclin-like protein [Thermochaetoides thermophila DSM 1495]|jgi:Cyclin.|uniref:Cyclin-like protein n=1 Tax=Chaetomium thermophilum (strain DSM 1495 / CBS 144.50 / IMI 039719) TaxID=759272 RepID=G0S6N4_CHATD|nr:cyclin-like protein [Thermochaetoides thermophila DSM 1495]EGS21636.1 cyclin-like protein [Thermochaetoides thermophila DSM 1495]
MPGGVCAVLDYDVELMADYVAEMATRLVTPHTNTVNPAFRKFVCQILTSTRLPSTTILLGMNYLAKRINMMDAVGQKPNNEGQIWRMLTIALLLGSKFLDDNTFQNKSWSEVSGISVQELNTLEYEWLGAIGWSLYVHLDESKDYQAWLANWKAWKETRKRERQTNLTTSVESDSSRARAQYLQNTWYQMQVAEYKRYEAMKANEAAMAASYRRDQSRWASQTYSWSQPAPSLTPPDSGYGTPEYPNPTTLLKLDYVDASLYGSTATSRHYGNHQNPSYNAKSGAYYPYAYNFWQHPRMAGCPCAGCTPPQPVAYFDARVYGQAVVG